MRNRKGWIMLEQDARSMLRLIQERITSGNIEVAQRDALIRLRSMIEDDVAELAQSSDASPSTAHLDATFAGA